MAMMFEEGNFDIWDAAIVQQLPQAMTTARQTVIPVVEAALLALVGNNKEFSRRSAQVTFGYDAQDIPAYMVLQLTYAVTSFAVGEASQEDVARDEAFINGYITQLPSIKCYPTKIDVREGLVTTKVVISVTQQLGRR